MKDRVGRLRRRKLGPPLAAIFGFTRWSEDLTPDIYRAHWRILVPRDRGLVHNSSLAIAQWICAFLAGTASNHRTSLSVTWLSSRRNLNCAQDLKPSFYFVLGHCYKCAEVSSFWRQSAQSEDKQERRAVADKRCVARKNHARSRGNQMLPLFTCANRSVNVFFFSVNSPYY